MTDRLDTRLFMDRMQRLRRYLVLGQIHAARQESQLDFLLG